MASRWAILPAAIVLATIAAGLYFKTRREEPKPSGNLPQPYGRDVVRLALDSGAVKLSSPEKLTAAEMLAFERPKKLSDAGNPPDSQRIAPFETTEWTITCKLESIVEREDHDYYLILRDGTQTLVAEAPDPSQCQSSPLYGRILLVRTALEQLNPTGKPRTVNSPVKITGIGFFGKPGLETNGGRNNGARLSPIIAFEIQRR